MHRRFALLLLVLATVGCERYRSRAQGPFPRNQPNTAPAVRTPLALNGPTPPAAPGGGSEESPLVPPRPPEPGSLPYAVVPPQAPKAPVVEEEPGVQPAGGLPPRKKPATPAAPPQPMTPSTPAPVATANLEPLRKIAAATAETVKTLGLYEARFTRRENVDGTPGPLEEVIFRFRAEPMAVYMKNVSEAGLGREVLYNPTQHADKIHVIVGKGDSRLVKPGFKAPSLSPDSPQVRSKSRHSIRESGVGNSAGKFLALMAKYEAGKIPGDTLKFAGAIKREDYPNAQLEGVEEVVRKGDEGLPSGGTRHWFFDMKAGSPSRGLPVLVILYDGNGKELEYYRYTNFTIPAKLTDADFDPSKMGSK